MKKSYESTVKSIEIYDYNLIVESSYRNIFLGLRNLLFLVFIHLSTCPGPRCYKERLGVYSWTNWNMRYNIRSRIYFSIFVYHFFSHFYFHINLNIFFFKTLQVLSLQKIFIYTNIYILHVYIYIFFQNHVKTCPCCCKAWFRVYSWKLLINSTWYRNNYFFQDTLRKKKLELHGAKIIHSSYSKLQN